MGPFGAFWGPVSSLHSFAAFFGSLSGLLGSYFLPFGVLLGSYFLPFGVLLGPFLGSYFLPFVVTVGHFGVPFPSFNPLGPFWVLFGHFWVPFPSFPAGGSSHGLSHACGSPYGVTVGRALILGPNE